jgi:hypothetical protein
VTSAASNLTKISRIPTVKDFDMFSGLTFIKKIAPRNSKEEFTTYTDPYIEQAFKSTLPPGMLQRTEDWSRSYYTVEAHINSLMKFNKPILPAPTNDYWEQTVKESFEYFSKLPKVSSFSAKTQFDQVNYHQSTSAGYGYNYNPQPSPTNKGPPGSPNHTRATRIASKIVHEMTQHNHNGTFVDFLRESPMQSTPDIAFTRTQLAELPDTKIRNVFGECFHYVILEGLTAQPLISMFMVNDTFYYIGKDPLTGVPDLINNLPVSDTDMYLSADWKGFDSSVQPYEIDIAFDLIESILIFPDIESHLTFRYCRALFLSRKVLSPDGSIFLRYGGVPSGSYYTHLVDSIINWIRIRYLCKKNFIPIYSIKTHGDDSLSVITANAESVIDISSDASLDNWTLNLAHSALVQDRSKIEFLGRTTKFGTSYRDLDRSLRLMLYPEYPVHDPQISIARLRAIDEDSGSRLTLIPNVYHSLANQYGDDSITLPPQFLPFSQRSYIESNNISI